MGARNQEAPQTKESTGSISRRDAIVGGAAALISACFGTGCASTRPGSEADTASRHILGKGVEDTRAKSPLEIKQSQIGNGVSLDADGNVTVFVRPIRPTTKDLVLAMRTASGELVVTDMQKVDIWSNEVKKKLDQAGQTNVVVDLNGHVYGVSARQELKIRDVDPCPREMPKIPSFKN